MKKKVSSAHLPWMWIGMETQKGEIVSLTDIVDISVEYGDCVDSQFLQILTGMKNARRWIYLDSKTLKEEEIPADGLIIENDSDE